MNMHAEIPAPSSQKKILVSDILNAVSAHYEISYVHLISAQRTARFMRPRHVAMYLAAELTPASTLAIGRMMGGRDHTTVLNGVGKIKRMLETDTALKQEVADIKSKLLADGDDGQLWLPFRPWEPENEPESVKPRRKRTDVEKLLRSKVPEPLEKDGGYVLPSDVVKWRLRRANLAHLIDMTRAGGRWA